MTLADAEGLEDGLAEALADAEVDGDALPLPPPGGTYGHLL